MAFPMKRKLPASVGIDDDDNDQKNNSGADSNFDMSLATKTASKRQR